MEVDESPLTNLLLEVGHTKAEVGVLAEELEHYEDKLCKLLFEDVLEMTKQGQMINFARQNRMDALRKSDEVLDAILLEEKVISYCIHSVSHWLM